MFCHSFIRSDFAKKDAWKILRDFFMHIFDLRITLFLIARIFVWLCKKRCMKNSPWFFHAYFWFSYHAIFLSFEFSFEMHEKFSVIFSCTFLIFVSRYFWCTYFLHTYCLRIVWKNNRYFFILIRLFVFTSVLIFQNMHEKFSVIFSCTFVVSNFCRTQFHIVWDRTYADVYAY